MSKVLYTFPKQGETRAYSITKDGPNQPTILKEIQAEVLMPEQTQVHLWQLQAIADAIKRITSQCKTASEFQEQKKIAKERAKEMARHFGVEKLINWDSFLYS